MQWRAIEQWNICPQIPFQQLLGDPKMLKLQSLLMPTSASKPPLILTLKMSGSCRVLAVIVPCHPVWEEMAHFLLKAAFNLLRKGMFFHPLSCALWSELFRRSLIFQSMFCSKDRTGLNKWTLCCSLISPCHLLWNRSSGSESSLQYSSFMLKSMGIHNIKME